MPKAYYHLLMEAIQHQQPKIKKHKKDSHPGLFHQPTPADRNIHFQTIYQKFKNNNEQPTNSHPQNLPLNNQGNNPYTPIQSFKTQILSPRKQTGEVTRSRSKKSHKMSQQLWQNAKHYDLKDGSSKKSTDNSESTQIEKVRAENRQYQEVILAGQKKMGQLERKIAEEKKQHELRKQIYHHNIVKLQKRMDLGSKCKVISEEEQCDRLSIISK